MSSVTKVMIVMLSASLSRRLYFPYHVTHHLHLSLVSMYYHHQPESKHHAIITTHVIHCQPPSFFSWSLPLLFALHLSVLFKLIIILTSELSSIII